MGTDGWLPQTNARLLAIHAPGSSEDFDKPQGALGAAKWSGDSDAYVKEKLVTSYAQAPGRLDKISDTRMIIPATLHGEEGQDIDIVSGDWVVYDYSGKQLTQRVQDLDAAIYNLVSSTVRLHLDPASQRAS